MAELLAITLPTLTELLTDVQKGLTAGYAGVVTRTGKTLSAFTNTSLLYPFGWILARRDEFLYAFAREAASQATPFGATGSRLAQWLAALDVVIPTPATAQLTIAITGRNNFSLDAGDHVANAAGDRYTLDAPVAFGPGESTIQVNVTAEAQGSQYNLAVNDTVTVDDPSDDVNASAPVVAILAIGSDPASEEEQSRRLQAALGGRTAPRNIPYYVEQTLALDPTIGEVLIDPAGFSSRSVVIYPLLALDEDEKASTPWLIKVPSGGQVAAWETALRDDDTRGTNDDVFVRQIATPQIDISATVSPLTADTIKAVNDALDTRFAEDRTARGKTIANSEILGAMTNAPGVTSILNLDIQPGTGATTANVPNPGATSDVVSLHGQECVTGVVNLT